MRRGGTIFRVMTQHLAMPEKWVRNMNFLMWAGFLIEGRYPCALRVDPEIRPVHDSVSSGTEKTARAGVPSTASCALGYSMGHNFAVSLGRCGPLWRVHACKFSPYSTCARG